MADNTPLQGDSSIVLLRKIVALLGGNPDSYVGSTEQELLFQWAQLVCGC